MQKQTRKKKTAWLQRSRAWRGEVCHAVFQSSWGVWTRAWTRSTRTWGRLRRTWLICPSVAASASAPVTGTTNSRGWSRLRTARVSRLGHFLHFLCMPCCCHHNLWGCYGASRWRLRAVQGTQEGEYHWKIVFCSLMHNLKQKLSKWLQTVRSQKF